MRKSCIFILGIIFMLSGCSLSNGSDIPSEAESIESADITEETPDQSGNDGAPAGISDARISSAVETELSGVSLVKDDYDYIRDMVSFDGEIVPFEELGFETYVCRTDKISENGRFVNPPNAADKELLYFFEHNYWGTDGWSGEEIVLVDVHEYNLLTGTSESVETADNCTGILYIDREYILYYNAPESDGMLSEYRFYLTDRTTGETVEASDIAVPFQYGFGHRFVRCGDYLFFTRTENLGTDSEEYSETADILVRYSLTRNRSQVVGAAELLGAVGDEVIAAPFGGLLERVHYTLDISYFSAASDSLYTGGEQIGYVTPTNRSPIFGERYEAGRLLPNHDKNVYLPVLVTNYGTRVDELVLTENAAAAVRISGNSDELIVADVKNKRAAALPKYGNEVDYGYLMADGNWIYYSFYDDNRIIAINTGS